MNIFLTFGVDWGYFISVESDTRHLSDFVKIPRTARHSVDQEKNIKLNESMLIFD